MRNAWIAVGLFLVGSSALPSQVTPLVEPADETVRKVRDFHTAEAAPAAEFDASYRLLAGDQVRVSVREVTQLYPQDALVGEDGSITIPLAGRVPVIGMTIEEAQGQIAEQLKRMVHDPHVGITLLKSARVVPVSVLGEVAKPGMYQLAGPRTIMEVLALAGGITPDAGYRVRVSRPVEQGPLEIDGVEVDSTGAYTLVDIPLLELTEGLEPGWNIQIGPHDVISVPRGKMVYVIGAVGRGGGYVLSERQEISVLELLALAGGLGPTAAKKRVTILRSVEGQPRRTEIPVDVQELLDREALEVYLQSNDILLVPESGSKKTMTALVNATAFSLPQALLWRIR